MENITVSLKSDDYVCLIKDGRHTYFADENSVNGGQDKGPNPFELLLSSLGSCTAITLKMYAKRKAWQLDEINVSLSFRKDEHNAQVTTHIHREISFKGNLSAENKLRLLQIAKVCPVAKILSGQILIESILNE